MKNYLTEPYKLFFPVGFILGLWGIALWVLFVLAGISYPASAHSYLMIGGFLSAFTTGFLMTIVPRFTGTFAADPYEILISLVTLLALPFVASQGVIWPSLCLMVGHINLVFFFLRRFFCLKVAIPQVFLFIPSSLILSILGHGLIIMSSFGTLPGSCLALGRDLAYYAFMLGIVLGVGSKIIPAFSGYGPMMTVKPAAVYITMAAFFSSFFVQDLVHQQLGLLIRFGAVLFVALKMWHVFQFPVVPSKMIMGLWLSCWGVLIGSLGGVLFPSMLVQWNHILFIAGFGLMTLMIGSRVINAHGGFEVAKLEKQPWLIVVIGLLIASSALRLVLYSSAKFYNPILLSSALLWLLGFGLWWAYVGRKSRGKGQNPTVRSC